MIGLETREQRDGLMRFLGERRASRSIVDRAFPGLATIVAAAEWRCRAQVGEVTLVLGEARMILRTET